MAFHDLQAPMTAEAFVAFADNAKNDARLELLDGSVYTMAAERVVHARMKNAILRQFERQIAARGLPCEAFPDGMAVRVDTFNVFEPDVLVRCGPPMAGDATMIPDPLIVVEVASPSTQRVDVLVKFARYFRNPAIMHYLIVVPTGGIVIHHKRGDDGRIVTTSYESGTITLMPPGLDLDLASLLADAT